MADTKNGAGTGKKPWQRITPKEIVGIVIAVALGFVTGLLVARQRSRN